MTKIELKHPIKLADGRELTTISLRDATVKDLKLAQRMAQTKEDVDTCLIAVLADEKLTNEDVEGLALSDWAAVQATFQSTLE